MSLDISLHAVPCAGCLSAGVEATSLYTGNYTHNVTPTWRRAGVYDALYNSEGALAGSVVEALGVGLDGMRRDPEGFDELNPSNGCGDYQTAMKFLAEFLAACREHPRATIRVDK